MQIAAEPGERTIQPAVFSPVSVAKMSRECKTILAQPQPIVGQPVACAISCGIGRGAGSLAGRGSHRVQAGRAGSGKNVLAGVGDRGHDILFPSGWLPFSGLSLALD